MATTLCAQGQRLPVAFDHARRLTHSSDSPGLVLVRDFIHDSLYHPEQGYFSARAAPVGALPAPIDFGALPGRAAYLRHVAGLYTQLQASWLTPAEIFQPHYGRAVASHLVAAHAQRWGGGVPLRIVEVGGGTGTLARDVLGWLRDAHPRVYATCTYTCLEISATLASLQREKVSAAGGGAGHGGRFSVLRRDATQRGAWGPRSLEPCAVIAMEVLDNLPHDRAWRAGPGEPWQETLVAGPPAGDSGGGGGSGGIAGRWKEVLRPAADPLILRCLAALQEQEEEGEGGRWTLGPRLLAAADRLLTGGEAGEAAFLPTGALQLMDALHAARPNHHLLAGDFDALPETRVPGRGAPLVATTAGGRTLDHSTYLVPRGAADIFFPSDFGLLTRLYTEAWSRAAAAAAAAHPPPRGSGGTGRGQGEERGEQAGGGGGSGGGGARVEARHEKAAALLARHAEPGATVTRDGYRPLLEDYTNTAFLSATAWGCTAA